MGLSRTRDCPCLDMSSLDIAASPLGAPVVALLIVLLRYEVQRDGECI